MKICATVLPLQIGKSRLPPPRPLLLLPLPLKKVPLREQQLRVEQRESPLLSLLMDTATLMEAGVLRHNLLHRRSAAGGAGVEAVAARAAADAVVVAAGDGAAMKRTMPLMKITSLEVEVQQVQALVSNMLPVVRELWLKQSSGGDGLVGFLDHSSSLLQLEIIHHLKMVAVML